MTNVLEILCGAMSLASPVVIFGLQAHLRADAAIDLEHVGCEFQLTDQRPITPLVLWKLFTDCLAPFAIYAQLRVY